MSVVLTRTFIAEDQCGNTSSTFVQTIQEATDLSASLVTDEVTCHGGSDGQALVSIEGGVAPYTTNWGGYDPMALEAGNYNVTVFDDNLCQQSLSFLITEPSEFSVELLRQSQVNDPSSGSIATEVVGMEVPLIGLRPTPPWWPQVSTRWWPPTPLAFQWGQWWWSGGHPEDLELNGSASVAQGDSAAYYYEYTLGSNYTWTYTGAEEQQVFNSFAISLMWTEPGFHEVCVTETNQDGCTGNPVCMEVFVEDDVWSVGGPSELDHLIVVPGVASDMVTIEGLSSHAQGTLGIGLLTGQRVMVEAIQGQNR